MSEGDSDQSIPISRSLSDHIMAGAKNAKKQSPQSSSASSEGNDEAAMAVIMSLLEVVKFLKISSHSLFSARLMLDWVVP